ncbi:MAG: IS1380 family transposase [Candidatus Nanoarchaeia archaeon]
MKLTIEGTDEIMSPNIGLAVAGSLMKSLRIGRELNKIRLTSDEPEISNQDVLRSYLGLLLMGRTNFEDIELYRNDGIFRILLDIKKVPSAATLRQRFDAARGAFDDELKRYHIAVLKQCRPSRIVVGSGKYMPIDLDVSVFDNSGSHKEGVSWTYKGRDGYSPNFAYAGIEGYMANCELRPGSQHTQKGTPAFIRDTMEILDNAWGTETRYLFRMDSGNDSDENLLEFKDRKGKFFVIKRNLRKESLDGWLAIAKERGTMTEPRQGKKIWLGDVFREVKDIGPVRMVFKVVERTSDRKGQAFLVPEIEVETYWTNLPDSPDTIIELYHQHGTSEQFHSELKSDMDVERLPSGKFLTNSLVLKNAMMGFNILRKMGCDLLSYAADIPAKFDVTRRRIKSVIQNLVNVAGKLVSTGGRRILKISRKCPWLAPMERLFATYC